MQGQTQWIHGTQAQHSADPGAVFPSEKRDTSATRASQKLNNRGTEQNNTVGWKKWANQSAATKSSVLYANIFSKLAYTHSIAKNCIRKSSFDVRVT